MALILFRYWYLHWQNVFSAFLFLEFESKNIMKLVSSKITFSVLLVTIHNYFSFFLEHLNNKFETTLRCTLVVVWNYYYDYQMTQTGSRTTVKSKMELSVSIFDNFHSLAIVTLDPTVTTNIFNLQSWILIYTLKVNQF